MKSNCGNCLFVGNLNTETNLGCCRRFPPTLMVQPMPAQKVIGARPEIDWNNQASAYPMIVATGWCGEHKDAPSAIFNS